MDNVKVSYKILIMVIIAAVGMAIVGVRGAVSIQNANEQMARMYEDDMRSVELLGQACEKMRTIQVRSMQVIADASRLEELSKSQAKDIDDMEALLGEYASLAAGDGNDAAVQEMMGYWESFRRSMPAVMSAVKSGGSEAGIAEYNRAARQDTVKLRDSLTALSNATREAAFEANQQNAADDVDYMVVSLDKVKGAFQLVDNQGAQEEGDTQAQRVCKKHPHAGQNLTLLGGHDQGRAQKRTYTGSPAQREDNAEQQGRAEAHFFGSHAVVAAPE